MSRRKKKKGERYIDRWLKEHPRISLYLKKDQHDKILSIASKKNMGIKEFILSLIDGFEKYYNEIYNKGRIDGYNAALEKFVKFPGGFYNEIKSKYKIEPALFSAPCSICKKPMIFNHTKPNWDKVKKALYEGFESWHHVCCKEVEDGIRESCEHMK
jgi:hypothetical protein